MKKSEKGISDDHPSKLSRDHTPVFLLAGVTPNSLPIGGRPEIIEVLPVFQEPIE